MAYKIKQRPKGYHDSYILEEYITEYAINSLSRYKHVTSYLLADDKIIKGVLNLWDKSILIQRSFDYIVTAAEENRIDIIATKFYGNASLYWLICYASSIEDPLNLPVGTPLVIPYLEDMFTYPNPLS